MNKATWGKVPVIIERGELDLVRALPRDPYVGLSACLGVCSVEEFINRSSTFIFQHLAD
jgi:hypothetical protein